MGTSYDLAHLSPSTFEDMVNALALRVLGAGHTSFGPGPDGGRDGYFEGEASYPSDVDRWSGVWYIQAKFHSPDSSKDPEAWLRDRIKEELEEFKKPATRRKWPDNWIVATNAMVSPTPDTGTWDVARSLVAEARPELAGRFDIWNGTKIIEFLNQHKDVAERYGHFLTPGHVITALCNRLGEDSASVKKIIRSLVVRELNEQRSTKLDNAGAHDDAPPPVHELFVDLPYTAEGSGRTGRVLADLVSNAAGSRRVDIGVPTSDAWHAWRRSPERARVWFLHGGPGRGKSTATQYFCQVQRAALILQGELPVEGKAQALAESIRAQATKAGFRPNAPRIPIYIELKLYAQWLGKRDKSIARGVITFLAETLSAKLNQTVLPGTLMNAFSEQSWVVVFDGLDEVPHDTRKDVAREVCHFIDNDAVEVHADLLTLCTSRPQGYAGEFAELEALQLNLVDLDRKTALAFGERLIRRTRAASNADELVAILRSAAEESHAVTAIMATPLQAHIMAVIVRDGGVPPKHRWELFNRFYDVIHSREAAKNLPDADLARVLREEKPLIRDIHSHLAFVLHARAETSENAITHLDLDSFQALAAHVVARRHEQNCEGITAAVMRAAKERIVLINTPDNGAHVRFDLRQLQEFFAAEFLYQDAQSHDELRERLECVAGDIHWREVVYFVLCGLIINRRNSELTIALDVLCELDGRNATGGERTMARRIGAGAHFAMELLREGILENNKDVRRHFTPVLDALAVSTNAMQDIYVLPPQSRRWLVQQMQQRVLELDPSESVGAAAGVMVGWEHDEPPQQFIERVRAFPTGCLARVLCTAWSWRGVNERQSRHAEFPPLTLWGELAIEFLARPDWHAHRDAVACACDIVPGDITPSGLHYALADVGNLEDLYPDRYLSFHVEKKGWAEIDYFVVEFPTQHAPYRALAERLRSGGFFTLAASALAFAIHGSLSTYRDLLATIGDADWSILGTLSYALCVHIPVPSGNLTPRALLDELQPLTEEVFQSDWRNTKHIGGHPAEIRWISYSTRTEGSEKEFLTLINKFPDAATRVWLDLQEKRRNSLGHSISDKAWTILHSPPVLRAVAEHLRNQPVILLREPAQWVDALRLLTPHAPDLRQRLYECSEPLFVQPRRDLFRKPFTPLSLDLPQEHRLLVPIANAVLVIELLGEPAKPRPRDESQKIATECAPYSLLISVAKNDTLDPEARVAAIILAMLHEHGSLSVALELQHFLRQQCARSPATHACTAVAIAVGILGCHAEPQAQVLIGDLIDASRQHCAGIELLEVMLELWRNQSRQPATRARAEQRWLYSASRE